MLAMNVKGLKKNWEKNEIIRTFKVKDENKLMIMPK